MDEASGLRLNYTIHGDHVWCIAALAMYSVSTEHWTLHRQYKLVDSSE